MRAVRWIDRHLEEILLVLFLLLIAFVMGIQVFMRKVMNSSLTWAEEFCRYCYVWTAFLSLGYTAKFDNMLRVSVVMDLFPVALRKAINIAVQLVTVAFFGIFAYFSVSVITGIQATNQTSTAMGLPMHIVYFCTIIGFSLGLIRSVQRLVSMLMNLGAPLESTREAVQKEAAEEAAMAKADLQGAGSANKG